jgi:hypothetical protein
MKLLNSGAADLVLTFCVWLSIFRHMSGELTVKDGFSQSWRRIERH